MQLVNRLITVAWVLFITWRFYVSESMPFDAFLIWVLFPFFIYIIRLFLLWRETLIKSKIWYIVRTFHSSPSRFLAPEINY